MVKVHVSSGKRHFPVVISSFAILATPSLSSFDVSAESLSSNFDGENITSDLRAELVARASDPCLLEVSSLPSGVGNGLFGVCICGVSAITGEGEMTCFGVLFSQEEIK